MTLSFYRSSEPAVELGPFNMELACASELETGDLITVDPLFGAELVLAADAIQTNGTGPARRLLLRFILPGGETNTRSVLRFSHEIITRWVPVISSKSAA